MKGRQTRTTVDRRLREVAASYKRQGYSVASPPANEALPGFLRDCHPDLIAEKDGDKVVIEIKPSTGLRGSNDLVEMANRVAEEPGWRLELVTVHTAPDYSDVLEPGWLDQMLRQHEPAGYTAAECFYRTEILAQVIRGVASANNIKTRDKTTLHLARELAYKGLLAQELLDRIEASIAWVDAVMRRAPDARSPQRQSQELEILCRDLLRHAQSPED